jgi:hypothetical protein
VVAAEGGNETQNGHTAEPQTAATLPAPTITPNQVLKATAPFFPAGYLMREITDAELLLNHAAEVGTEVEAEVRQWVLEARLASDANALTEEKAANLLDALTKLAAVSHPVTSASLRVCANPKDGRKVIHFYGKMAVILACLIVPISLSTFISSHVSVEIQKDVDAANALAVKLSDELGPPPPQRMTNEVGFGATGASRNGVSEKDVINDLQVFAGTIRAIEGQARQLNRFVGYMVTDPFADGSPNRSQLELPPGLRVLYAQEAADKIDAYQSVRRFAQSIRQRVSIYYGAIGACILPALYALLGACSYLLRSYEEQIRNCTFAATDRHAARFLIAGISGLVVGLFNISDAGSTLSPLAIAFLVGYGTDVFFSFLEGFLQMFKKEAPAKPPVPAKPKG